MWSLAIDFGTSFTIAATSTGGEPRLLEIDNSRYLPSLVCLGEDGELLTGAPARQLAAHLPERAERLPKQALVRAAEVRLGGRTVAVTDLVAAVLSRMHQEAVAHHRGESPQQVALTHPAAWSAAEQDLLAKAAEAAGLAAPVLISEPVAAAGYYADVYPIGVGDRVAVYDLGGGTFDTVVLCRTAEGFVVVGTPGGDPYLGGEDLDEALRDLVGELVAERDPGPWDELWAADDRPARRAQSLLRRDLTEAKESLSHTLSVNLAVPGYPDPVVVRRGQYEAAIEEQLQRSVAHLTGTVSAAGLTLADLTEVVLAGAASRTPRVSDLLAQHLGKLPLTDPDPKAVVVRGALRSLIAAAPPGAPAAPPPRAARRMFQNMGRGLLTADPDRRSAAEAER